MCVWVRVCACSYGTHERYLTHVRILFDPLLSLSTVRQKGMRGTTCLSPVVADYF